MNLEEKRSSATIFLFAGVLGAFLIMALLAWLLHHDTVAAPVGNNRARERHSNLVELVNVNTELLNTYGWKDQARGIVRIPIDRAMELTLQEWKNPEQAHSNLMARVQKATAPLPKKPEAPNPYE